MRALSSVAFPCLLTLAACGGTTSSPDAFSSPDAATPGIDAPSTSDAFSADDAFSGSDAFSASDAFSVSDAPSRTDAFGPDAGCSRPTDIDTSDFGADCDDRNPCSAGLTCLGVSGIVFDQFCGIPCEAEDGGECACPEGFTCGERGDKSGTHHECFRVAP